MVAGRRRCRRHRRCGSCRGRRRAGRYWRRRAACRRLPAVQLVVAAAAVQNVHVGREPDRAAAARAEPSVGSKASSWRASNSKMSLACVQMSRGSPGQVEWSVPSCVVMALPCAFCRVPAAPPRIATQGSSNRFQTLLWRRRRVLRSTTGARTPAATRAGGRGR